MVDELPSAGVSQELPLLSPQRDIHSESSTLTKITEIRMYENIL